MPPGADVNDTDSARVVVSGHFHSLASGRGLFIEQFVCILWGGGG